jgi:hypothetical protein
MVEVELFLGMVIAGLGSVLAAVGLVTYRRTLFRRMAVTALAFAVAAVGGALYVGLILAEGAGSRNAPVGLAAGVVASLVAFYLALFGREQ